MDPITAKQFLISRVIEEADLETVPLSEVERKMLQFTEVHPTIPDIYDVNDEFERNYDRDEYEKKVALLLKNARARDEHDNPNRKQEWKDALAALQKEDHYILVMVNQAFGEGANSFYILGVRARDLLIYTVIGVVIVLMIIFWPANH
ncbi:MAG TPA: hypothetical protein VFX22_01860 [Candidatus Kapabacteria bacterium]|nr:hypothetical protein [Candidatus Kapabacteria bacterium]